MIAMFNKEQIKGTCYFEVLPQKYEGVCWNNSSVYFNEETFLFFESIIYKIVPEYSHYGITVLNESNLLMLCEQIKLLLVKVKNATTFKEIINDEKIVTVSTEKVFDNNFEGSRAALLDVLNDFMEWILKNLTHSKEITILGV